MFLRFELRWSSVFTENLPWNLISPSSSKVFRLYSDRISFCLMFLCANHKNLKLMYNDPVYKVFFPVCCGCATKRAGATYAYTRCFESHHTTYILKSPSLDTNFWAYNNNGKFNLANNTHCPGCGSEYNVRFRVSNNIIFFISLWCVQNSFESGVT